VHMREHPFSMSSCADQSDRIEFGIKALGKPWKTRPADGTMVL
jgi:predicted ferric reductase